MKVFIIGPVSPYRGGIPHSNTVLCENLSKKHPLLSISFSRLFPKFLYPGRFQKEKSSSKKFKSIELIDSINPFSWEKCVKLIKKEKPAHVIFQWWSTFFFPCYSYIAARIKDITTVSVVCQNVLPHEEGKIHSILTKIFFSNAHHFTVLSKEDLQILKRLMPDAKARHLIEPTTERVFGGKSYSKAESKNKLGLRGKNILFFGFVRPYKGLEYLIRAMPLLIKKFNDLTLLIAGEFWKDKKKYISLIKKLGIERNVKIEDKYIPNELVPVYFIASDAVILPYISSTESGIIQVAYGLQTPVIATAVGGNYDLIDDKKTGLLVPPKNAKKLAEAIEFFYKNNMEEKIKRNMADKKDIFSWTKEKEDILFGDY